MRYRVIIRAIVQNKGKILLLRRIGGNRDLEGLFELPGGSLHEGEQPIDALKRSLQIHAGIEPETFKLLDGIVYQSRDTVREPYLYLVYSTTIKPNDRVTTDDEYDRILWIKPDNVRHDILTDATNVLVDSAKYLTGIAESASERATKHQVGIIHSDGASRGNPGPSSSAYIITDHTGRTVLAQGGKYLGRNTSGIAEYTAVILALEKATELGLTDIEFYSDNLMLVNHINGILRVNNPEFIDAYNRVIKLLFNFRRVHFHHIHREYNSLADSLANRILDEQANKTDKRGPK